MTSKASNRKISSAWTSTSKNEESKRKTEEQVMIALEGPVIRRLLEILMRDYEALVKQELSINSYSDSSWSHKQAHINGRKAQILVLRDLLSVRDQGTQ